MPIAFGKVNKQYLSLMSLILTSCLRSYEITLLCQVHAPGQPGSSAVTCYFPGYSVSGCTEQVKPSQLVILKKELALQFQKHQRARRTKGIWHVSLLQGYLYVHCTIHLVYSQLLSTTTINQV